MLGGRREMEVARVAQGLGAARRRGGVLGLGELQLRNTGCADVTD